MVLSTHSRGYGISVPNCILISHNLHDIGGTELGHCSTIARSRSVWGPFLPCPHNPLLYARSPTALFQTIGHADIFTDDRDPERIRYWVVFLATRVIKDAFPIGRETCLAKVDWSGEWPVVATAALENEEVGGMIDLAKLSAPPQDSEALDVLASPRHHLLYLRNTSLDACNSPYNASNSAQPSILILYSQQITLTDPSKSPTFIGYRQQNLYFESYVQLNITGLADRSEVGLAIYLDHEHHFAACVEKRGGSCRAHVKRVHPDLNSMPDDRDVVNSTPLPIAENATVIRLRVLGEPEKYTFEIDLNPGRTAPGVHPLGFGMAKDVSGGFTGTVVAIYSSHEGSNGSIIFVQEWKYRRM